MKTIHHKGALLILVIVFGAIFFTMVTGFLGYVITQYRSQEVRIQKELAREIAEAGLNYYKWFLAHYPGDVTNGTGLPGPYTMQFDDPELGRIGEFDIALQSTAYCGAVSAINITATGRTDKMPNLERTVFGRYARPTVAEYSFIINADVWAGSNLSIIGPYHSNGGIRMDGTNNSTVSSQQASWTCTSSFGCSPSGTRDGVFTTTANPNTALFNFPSVPINFTGLSVNLSDMRTRAINNGGLRFAASGAQGYNIEFKSNGTIDVYRVNSTIAHRGMITVGSTNTWQNENNIINARSFVGNYTIPTTCPLIFVEDKVWLEGVVNQKVTIAAANPTIPGSTHSIILQDNISYTSTSTSGLLAIAEQDVLIGVDVPDDMSLSGIFIAQNGRFGRNFYCESTTYCATGDRLPTAYRPYAFRDSLTMTGTIVSNGRVGTKWMSGTTWSSGFDDRFNTYDRNLVDNPPPLTPNTSDDYKFVEWRDVYQ